MKYFKMGVGVLGFVTFFTVCALLGSMQKTDGKAEQPLQKIVLETNHKKCGHQTATIKNESDISIYPQYKWVKTENNTAYLTGEINDYCPNHFYAYLKEDLIVIENKNKQILHIIHAKPLSLTESDKQRLQNGVSLDSQKELTAFLEDYNS